MRRIGQTSSPPGAWGALDRALIRWWEKTHSDKRWNYVRITLSPFMKWCAAKAIAPECVTDRLISGYVASKTFKRKDYDAAHEKFLRRSPARHADDFFPTKNCRSSKSIRRPRSKVPG